MTRRGCDYCEPNEPCCDAHVDAPWLVCTSDPRQRFDPMPDSLAVDGEHVNTTTRIVVSR